MDVPVNDTYVPEESETSYDGLGRTVKSETVAFGVNQYATTTSYPGVDQTDVTPPAGGTATSAFTDALGQEIASWKYTTATPTDNAANAVVTNCTYNASGQQATISDSAGEQRLLCLLGHSSSGGCNGAGAVCEVGSVLSDASAAGSFLGTIVSFCLLPMCEAVAAALQTASRGLGVASPLAYMAGGDKDDAIDALAGTVAGFLTSGLDKGAGSVAYRGSDEVMSGFVKGGAFGLISDSLKVGDKSFATGVQALAIGSVGFLGNSGDAAFVAHSSNPFDTDPGAS